MKYLNKKLSKMSQSVQMSEINQMSNQIVKPYFFTNKLGEEIPVKYCDQDSVHIETIMNEKKFKVYLENTVQWDKIKASKINILSHFMFGPKTVGFVFLNMDCVHRATGKKLPGVIFFRGGAVSAIVIIHNSETNQKHWAKVRQTRVPKGDEIDEAPAGMLDSEVDPDTQQQIIKGMKGPMINELKEEIGVDVKNTGMYTGNPNTQFEHLEYLGKINPSPGGCDEVIYLYWYQVSMTSKQIAELDGKETGTGYEEGGGNEFIKVVVEPLTLQNVLQTEDVKAISIASHLMAKYPGFIPIN